MGKAGTKKKGTPKLAQAVEQGSGSPRTLVSELEKAVTATLPKGAIGAQKIDVSQLVRNAATSIAPAIGMVPEEIEAAMQEQGLGYAEPFAPGRPLNPYFGFNRRPRAFDYSVGRNISTRPRQYRVPFETLTKLIQAYDVAQVCIRHIIDDLRSMPLLFSPQDGVEDDVTEEIKRAAVFWSRPSGEWTADGTKRVGGLNWHEWLGEWGQDTFRYDAGSLSKRRDANGRLIGVETVDARTVAPLIDYMGRAPSAPAPAYLQFVQGLPWDWMQWNDFVYTRMNPLPEDVYGLAPIEAVLMTANTDLRYQWHWLQYFTEGTVPDGFMEAPPDASSTPDALAEWQEAWEDWLMGDQSQKVKIRWVPAGSKYEAAKEAAFDKNFPIWLMRHTVAAYGLTPQDLGWTDDVKQDPTADTQTDVQFRISTMPKSIGVAAILNDITQNELGLRVQIRFDTGREKEDRLQEAQAMTQYVFMGAISPDEVRGDILGKRVQADEMCPRFIMSERLGPIPLAYLMSVGGVIDPLTGSPEPGTVIPSQFVLPGNQAPDPTSTPEEQKLMAIAQHSADQPGEAAALPDDLKETPAQIAASEADQAAVLVPSTAQPGQKPPMGKPNPTGAKQEPPPPAKTAVAKDEIFIDEDFDFPAITKALRMWRKSSRDRVRRGWKPRLFLDPDLPPEVGDVVWQKLERAKTREEVDMAFSVQKAVVRMDKSEVNYRAAAFPAIRCGTCAHMLAGDRCERVDGDIDAEMVCDLFSYRGKVEKEEDFREEFIKVRHAAERVEQAVKDLQ